MSDLQSERLDVFDFPSFGSIGLSFQEKKIKIDFQNGSYGGHLEFMIQTILAIFELQVTLILPIKFQFSWAFGSGEAQNRFSTGPHGSHLRFSIRMIFVIFFYLQVFLVLSAKFRVNWPFGSEKAQIYFFLFLALGAILFNGAEPF